MVLAFSGLQYCGMQDQIDVSTIEGTLKKSLWPQLAHDSKKAGYTLAGRTDKGVSAVCQVVSTSCQYERIAFLPSSATFARDAASLPNH